MSLQGKKILVTGGCGFIGSHVAQRLVDLGARVVILDDLSRGKEDNIADFRGKVAFIKGDIRDENILEEALEGVELINHQAALLSVPESVKRPLEYNDVNVNGSIKLFLIAKKKGIKRIVCASSSSVYGDAKKFPVVETDLPLPISPYAATKLIVEHYSHVFSMMYDMQIVNLRYFNVYGPRQAMDDEYSVVIPKFINCLLKAERPPIYGDGTQERDFIYIDNVVDTNVAALEKKDIGPEVMNVALNQPNSVNGLLKALQQIMGTSIEPEFSPPRKGDVYKSHADISRAKEILGWTPQVDFYSGLKKTVNWFKNKQ